MIYIFISIPNTGFIIPNNFNAYNINLRYKVQNDELYKKKSKYILH